MTSACHHASKHTAKARHALVRELSGDGDAAFWRAQRFLHAALAGRPISHADRLIRFSAMADTNPLLPGVLKQLFMVGVSPKAAQVERPAPPPSIS